MQLDSFAVMGETVSFILWLFWSIWHSYFRKSRIMCSSSLMAIRGAWHYGEHLSSEREIHQHLWRGRGKKTPPMEEGKKNRQLPFLPWENWAHLSDHLDRLGVKQDRLLLSVQPHLSHFSALSGPLSLAHEGWSRARCWGKPTTTKEGTI